MKKKILVVDPSLYSRMILRDMLRSLGYHVCEASSGGQAIDTCKHQRPDVVMVEAKMKDMDGTKAIEHMRADDPSLVAVICASAGQRSVVSQAFSAGASGFCAKPYRENVVKRALNDLNRQPKWV